MKMTNFDTQTHTHSLTSEGVISHISVFEGEREERGQLGLSWGFGWVRESTDARGALPSHCNAREGEEREKRRRETVVCVCVCVRERERGMG